MNFLAPQFLFGLLAIFIPIIIHLFNFRKVKKVYFSSNKHLRKITEETSSRRNLKHLLVLLARIFFISFLVLAFAQPFIAAEEKELQDYVQIYIDNSYSMSNEVDEDFTALDHGINQVNKIIDQYPAGTRFRLLTNDFESFSNIFRSGEEVREITTELSYSKITRNSNQVRARLNVENIDNHQVDTYWISDFQSSSYTEPILDSLTSVRILPALFTSTKNIFVDSIYTNNPFFGGNERTKLFAKLVNLSEQSVDNLNLKIFINDTQITTNSISIPPNSFKIAEFDLAFGLEKFNRCRISFEDFPVTFDNEFYFVLNNNQRIKVVEIRDPKSNSNIEKVYANNELFDYKVYPVSNINYNEISSADVVILHGLSGIDNSLSILLNNYLESTGTLCVIPDANINLSEYSQLLGGISLQKSDSTDLIDMVPPDFNNPFFENVFEDRNPNMKMPKASNSLFWFSDRNAILKLQNGQPFLSKINRGGEVYLFSSPFDSDFTNFPLHALFVPVMYKIAMSGSSQSQDLFHSLSSEQLILPLDTVIAGEMLRLTNGEREIIPQQRISGNEAILDLPPMEISTGFYSVIQNSVESNVLAFNYDQNESDLSQLSFEEIGNRFIGSTYEIFSDASGSNVDEVLFAKYQTIPLWKYAILLAILFIVIEIMLFKFMP